MNLFKIKIQYLGIIFLISSNLLALDTEKKAKILWPLEMRVPITGSFAEFRNSHMHMGCDFKTYGINGFSVLGIFDGNISSMAYSEFGYGLTISLSSPSIFATARYAHLNDLQGDIKGLEELRHSLRLLGSSKGFSVSLKPEMFPVRAGAKLARSGETGSGVSHLHLEISDKKTEEQINPLTLPNYIQKDITPPTIQTVFIDTDTGFNRVIPALKLYEGKYNLDSKEDLQLSGKIKFKVGGFDYMTSKNQNNVYGIRLAINNKIVYQKILDRMKSSEIGKREILYDINKSSLSPPLYVYNLFDATNSSAVSLDLNSYPENSKINIEITLSDASGNISNLNFVIKSSAKDSKKSPSSSGKINYSSTDGQLNLNFTGTLINGEGNLEINELDKISEDLLSPGFTQVNSAYEVKVVNFSWKGEVKGTLKGTYPLKEDGLYIYDTNFKRWLSLNSQKKNGVVSFTLTKVGIISMMKDKSPPIVNYPYMTYREFNLSEIKDHRMLERFYAITDKGSGISLANTKVLFEGKQYTYEYDPDRGYIKVEFPLTLRDFKKNYILQIKIQDKAGNASDWFTDLISF